MKKGYEIKYEMLDSSLPKYKEVHLLIKCKGEMCDDFIFFPEKFSDQKCLRLAKKETNKKIKNGEFDKQFKKLSKTPISNKKKKGIIATIAAAAVVVAVTVTTVLVLRNNTPNVTLTLNSGVGSFEGDLLKKEVVIKKGTKLNDLLLSDSSLNPSFQIETIEASPLFSCLYWSKNNDYVPISMDYIINSNIELTAKYFNSLLGIKGLYLGMLGDAFFRAYAQWPYEDFLNFYNEATDEILSSNNESHVIGFYRTLMRTINASVSYGESGFQTLKEYYNKFCDSISNYQDQRAQTLGTITAEIVFLSAFFSESTLNEYFNLVVNSLDKIVLEYDYLYQRVNQSFLNACNVVSEQSRLDIMFEAIEHFSKIFEEKKEIEKMQSACSVINDFFVQAEVVPLEKLADLFAKTKAKVEEIL